jgi:sigma-E factor negative regulatory protein RseB
MSWALPRRAARRAESTAFSKVEIGVRPQPEQVLQYARIEATGCCARSSSAPAEAEGWCCPPVAVPARAHAPRHGNRGWRRTGAQSVFSDGLTHVSLFVESFKPEHHRNETQAQQGATATLTQRRGEHWVTVVGDVPPATLKLFAEALERRR